LRALSRHLRSTSVQAAFAYGAAFVLTFVCSTGIVLLVGAWRSRGQPALLEAETSGFATSASGLMTCAFVEAVVLAAVALTATRGQRGALDRLRLGPSRASPLGQGAAVLGLIGLSTAGGAVIQLVQRHGAHDIGVVDTFAEALGGATPLRVLLAVVTIGLAPAFAEEVFFRGLLQPALSQKWGRGAAIVVAALAFGLFHLDSAQGAVAFCAGLFLGWVAERLGSVRPGIAAHATNNILFVLVAAVSPEWASAPRVQPWMLACGAVVFVGAITTLRSGAAVRSTPIAASAPLSEGARGP
jgi:membrane protease YdiL (CAAX protease family)